MQELNKVQEERGNNYGDFADHMVDVQKIIEILKNHNTKKNNGNLEYPEGFETAMFYMVSKLVRLSATPMHDDSALDLSSYADLWLKRGIRNENR